MTSTILGMFWLSVAFAGAFLLFVGGRNLAARLFRIPDRLPPFGEAPAVAYKRALPGARLGVAAAGIIAVYMYAAALSTTGLLLQDEAFIGGTHVTVIPSKQAHAAGMLTGDQVVSINGAPITTWDELSKTVNAHPGEPLDVGVVRDGRDVHLTVTPGGKGYLDEGKIGVAAQPSKVTAGYAIKRGPMVPIILMSEYLSAITRAMTGTVSVKIAGPVRIVSEMNRASKGAGDLMAFLGALVAATILPIAMIASLLLIPLHLRPASPKKEGGKDTDRALLTSDRRPPPWRRLLARVVDFFVVAFAVAVLLVSLDIGLNHVLLKGTVLLFLSVPVEALLLSKLGFTPGKWLLGVVVRDAEGERLSFRAALRRSAGVWVWALGFGLTSLMVALATALMAYRRLRARGATYWDELDSIKVNSAETGVARIVIAAFVIVLGFVSILVSTLA
jgi:hypothetical protein